MDNLPQALSDLPGRNLALIVLALVILLAVSAAVRIVPQSEKFVVERFGRLRSVLGPGINIIMPFLDRVAHRISILERQLPTSRQDAITADNVLVEVETSVFYRIIEPEKTVYRIRDIDAAIATTVTGIVRSEIGTMELDQVQSNRAQLIERIRDSLANVVDDWGIEVTRAEILDVNLDDATRAAMLQQLNAERARRAQVTEAEGKRRAVELAADGALYAAEQQAKARRVMADAEAVVGAGAFAMVIEGTIEALAREITEIISIPTIGIGASPACDGQILVTDDALGLFSDFTPKFVKRFAELGGEIERAAKAYAEEVNDRRFPGLEHCYGVAKDKKD